MKTRFTEKDISDIRHYLEELKKNPEEKRKFNQAMRTAASKERKRKDGEFTAMILDSIRIP